MPYNDKSELPEAVKGMPSHARSIWMAAFNNAYKQYDGDEEKCFAVAWAAVKRDYEQDQNGDWHKKMGEPTVSDVHVPGIIDDIKDKNNNKKNIDERIKVRLLTDLYGIKLMEADEVNDKGLIEGKPIQLMRVGDWKHPEYGEFSITEDDIKAFTKNFEVGERELVIDYEHLSADPDIKGPVPAAGWITKLINKGIQGLWAIPYWTKRAVEYIKNGEYRFLSTEFDFEYTNKQGEQQGQTLFAIALTNRPFLEGMSPVLLSDNWERINSTRLEIGDYKKIKEVIIRMKDKILEALELDENTTDDVVIKTVLKLKEGVKNMEDTEKIKEDVKKLSELVLKDQDEIKRLSEDNKTLRDKIKEKEMNDVIDKALAEGRILPALKDHYIEWYKIDSERTAKLLSELPVIVDLREKGSDGDSAKTKEGMELVEEEIAKVMKEKNIDYAQASTLTFKEKPEMYKIYRKSMGFKD